MATQQASRAGIIAAFGTVCFVWGSVYLAIQVAIESLPPFLMVGSRLAAAGLILYVWVRWRGAPRPTMQHWKFATIIGGMVLTVGAGAVAWAQQMVPSGLTALLVATEPLWIILFDWWWHGGRAPGARVIAGLALGFAGMAVLVMPGQMGGRVHPLGAAVIVAASMSWAAGSLFSRTAPQPRSVLLGTAMQMFMGGVLLMLAGSVAGEWARLNLGAVTLRSWIAYAFLLIFASLITFPAYIWLLRVWDAARVSMYAYVNPVIAVLLGWMVANEPLTTRIWVAGSVIVLAVALVVIGDRDKHAPISATVPETACAQND